MNILKPLNRLEEKWKTLNQDHREITNAKKRVTDVFDAQLNVVAKEIAEVEHLLLLHHLASPRFKTCKVCLCMYVQRDKCEVCKQGSNYVEITSNKPNCVHKFTKGLDGYECGKCGAFSDAIIY